MPQLLGAPRRLQQTSRFALVFCGLHKAFYWRSTIIGVVVVVPSMEMVAVQWNWKGKPCGSLYVTVIAPV